MINSPSQELPKTVATPYSANTNNEVNTSEERSNAKLPFCNPLCEKVFKTGDIIRTILPCGH